MSISTASPPTVNPNIPNAEMIQAVLNGQVIQVTPNEGDGWTDMDPSVAITTLVRSAPGLKFRVKPRTLVHWLPVYRHERDGAGADPPDANRPGPHAPALALKT